MDSKLFSKIFKNLIELPEKAFTYVAQFEFYDDKGTIDSKSSVNQVRIDSFSQLIESFKSTCSYYRYPYDKTFFKVCWKYKKDDNLSNFYTIGKIGYNWCICNSKGIPLINTLDVTSSDILNNLELLCFRSYINPIPSLPYKYITGMN